MLLRLAWSGSRVSLAPVSGLANLIIVARFSQIWQSRERARLVSVGRPDIRAEQSGKAACSITVLRSASSVGDDRQSGVREGERCCCGGRYARNGMDSVPRRRLRLRGSDPDCHQATVPSGLASESPGWPVDPCRRPTMSSVVALGGPARRMGVARLCAFPMVLAPVVVCILFLLLCLSVHTRHATCDESCFRGLKWGEKKLPACWAGPAELPAASGSGGPPSISSPADDARERSSWQASLLLDLVMTVSAVHMRAAIVVIVAMGADGGGGGGGATCHSPKSRWAGVGASVRLGPRPSTLALDPRPRPLTLSSSLPAV